MSDNEKILLCRAHMSGREQQYIDEAFADDWVVPLGPNVDGFESDLREYMLRQGAEPPLEVCALSAGTAAIHLALVLLGVGPGDEVVCQSFTFAASANPIVYCGATPVFVDSEADTWNMDPRLLRTAILDRIASTGRKPKAVIAVDLYGMPARLDEIAAVAGEFGIPLVEDAAEALGSRYAGHPCGSFGDFGVLSFNGNKMITTSGGGALVCHSAEAKKEAVFYATQARDARPYYHHEHIGYNYRLSNISAGIGRGQMTILDEHIAHHRRLAGIYAEAFAGSPCVSLHTNPGAAFDSNYWLSTVLLSPDCLMRGVTPETLRQHFAGLNVETRALWKPMHMQPVYASAPFYGNGVSSDLFSRGLCIPSGPHVTPAQARMVAETLLRLTTPA